MPTLVKEQKAVGSLRFERWLWNQPDLLFAAVCFAWADELMSILDVP